MDTTNKVDPNDPERYPSRSDESLVEEVGNDIALIVDILTCHDNKKVRRTLAELAERGWKIDGPFWDHFLRMTGVGKENEDGRSDTTQTTAD